MILVLDVGESVLDMVMGVDKPSLAPAGMGAGVLKMEVQLAGDMMQGGGRSLVQTVAEGILTKLNRIRNQLKIGNGRNIAWIEGEIGESIIEIVAHSGQISKSGTAPAPSITRIFQSSIVNMNEFDAEIKILEHFATLHPDTSIKGVIRIYSERAFCNSCRDVLFR